MTWGPLADFKHRIVISGKDEASGALRAVGQSTQGTLRRLADLSQLSVNLGRHMRALGRVAGALGRQVASAAREFGAYEKAMSEVASISNFTSDEFAGLNKELKRFAVDFGVKATDAAAALYQTISAGSTSAADATAVMTQSLKFAKAAVTEPAAAVDLLTTVLNSYGLTAGDVTRASDLLFTTIRLGKTTGPELASSLGRVAPLAAKAGVSLEDLAGTMALLTKVLKTDQAATSLNALLKSITQATPEAAKAIAELNLEFFNEAALSQPGGIFNLLRELKERGGETIGELGRIIPESKALTAALVASGNEIQLAEVLDGIGGAAGATERALAHMTDDFDHQMNRLSSAWQVFQIDAFAGIGASKEFHGLIDDLVKALGALGGAFEGANKDGATFLDGVMKELRVRLPDILEGLVGALLSAASAFVSINESLINFALTTAAIVGKDLPPLTRGLREIDGDVRRLERASRDAADTLNEMFSERAQHGMIEFENTMAEQKILVGKLQSELEAAKKKYSALSREVAEHGVDFSGAIDGIEVLQDKLDLALAALRAGTSEDGGDPNVPTIDITAALPDAMDTGVRFGEQFAEGYALELEKQADLLDEQWEEMWEGWAENGVEITGAALDSISDSLVDHSTSWKEQYEEFGESVKSTMIDAFLEPILGAQSALAGFAGALLSPFAAVGQAINDVLFKPLVDGLLTFLGLKAALEEADLKRQQANAVRGVAATVGPAAAALAAMMPGLATGAAASLIMTFGASASAAVALPGLLAGAAAQGAVAGAAMSAAVGAATAASFAEGGRVTSRTFAEIGEAGPETIIPETRPSRARALLADLFARQPGLAGGGVSTINNWSISVTGAGNARELADTLVSEIDRRLGRRAR